MKKYFYLVLFVSLYLSCSTYVYENYDSYSKEINWNFSGLQFGFCHGGYSKTDREYDLIESLGAQWVRIDFQWNIMEPSPGVWDFSIYDEFMEKAEERGIKVLAILDYDTDWLHGESASGRYVSSEELPLFLNFIETVALRYGSTVDAFEIWNEPNLNLFWTGSDKDFFELTKKSLNLLKKISPSIPVAVGSIFYNPIVGAKSYLKRMINEGVLDNADALSLHPYTLSPRVLEQRIIDVRKLLISKGIDTPIWITEIGFPTEGSYPNKVSLKDQAKTVAETITRLGAAGVEFIIWYRLFDAGNPPVSKERISSEASFGLVWNNYELKPGAYPFTILANELKGAQFIEKSDELGGVHMSYLNKVKFRKTDGSILNILWTTGPPVTIPLNEFSVEKINKPLGIKMRSAMVSDNETIMEKGDFVLIRE